MIYKNKFVPLKTRDDHRHHAVDAITIACTENSHLNEISFIAGQYERHDIAKKMTSNFPTPWDGFFQEAENEINKILIHYEVPNRVLSKTRKKVFDANTAKQLIIKNKKIYGEGLSARGQLHEDTYYGKRKAPGEKEKGLHIRKKLEDLTSKMIEQIVDPTVKAQIVAHITNENPERDKKGKLNLTNVKFFGEDYSPQIFMPDGKTPIKKVRIRKESTNAVQLKDYNQWVEPGNNHAVVLYDTNDGKRRGKVITFWEAVVNAKDNQPIVNKNVDGDYLMHLKKGDMVLIDAEDIFKHDNNDYTEISNKLYYLRKFSISDGTIVLTFVRHFNANINADRAKFPLVIRKTPGAFKGIKVDISLTGKITIAKQL